MEKKKINLTYPLIQDLTVAVTNTSYGSSWYLDVEDEQTVIISDYADGDITEEDIEEGYRERFFSVPEISSREGWEQMERFILQLKGHNERSIERLTDAINGPGAFGRFKNIIYQLGIQEEWYEFKDREDTQFILDWLYEEDLISQEDIARGLQLREQWWAGKKRRDEDITKMIKGASVIGNDNSGHEDKITPGKTYEVLDERRDQLLIRIKDDRGKVCWLPKSHFELQHLRKG